MAMTLDSFIRLVCHQLINIYLYIFQSYIFVSTDLFHFNCTLLVEFQIVHPEVQAIIGF